MLGLGSGYRKYEFDGFGVDFDARRDIQEEALPLLMELLQKKRALHRGTHFRFAVDGAYELYPHALQEPHPGVYLAGATERSIAVAGRMGLGLMLSSWTPFAELARQSEKYRAHLDETPVALRKNPTRGQIDIARLVYVAETDAAARRDSEGGILRHLEHFASGQTSGYLGTVQEKTVGSRTGYDALAHDITDLASARAKLGIKPTDENIDKKTCADLKKAIDANQAVVEDGITRLNKAIELRPDYDDAMAYLNLMYRERADLECDNPDARKADLKSAEDWVDKTIATKKVKAEKAGPSGIVTTETPAK